MDGTSPFMIRGSFSDVWSNGKTLFLFLCSLSLSLVSPLSFAWFSSDRSLQSMSVTRMSFPKRNTNICCLEFCPFELKNASEISYIFYLNSRNIHLTAKAMDLT